ncbi:hypothetical protein U9M48_007503 [Paspalum notatum var. saurae]|uniref:Cytochrome P450 n=1 Tax=Paspalum notatum var. saurae TaxID=547442 RepID=A0AAQ3Q0M9_PASNO
MALLAPAAAALLLLALMAAAWAWDYAVARLVLRPRAVAAAFRAQGVQGPPYRFLRGSNGDIRRMRAEADAAAAAAAARLDVRDHDYLPRVMPHFLAWKRRYGAPFLYWFGAQPRVCLLDYDNVRQVLRNKSGHFVKNDTHPTILAMLGKGLVLVEGADWVRHRRVLNPAFAMDKLKMMSATMAGCAERLITGWEELASSSSGTGQVEVEFSRQFQDLTADVISHTAFGSSYKEGKEVFHTQQQLMRIALATFLNVQLPGFKYLPTKSNRLKWKLEKKIKTTLMGIIQPRQASARSGGYGDDLLGLMLQACFTTEQGGKRPDELTLTMDEIIDECKTFFFAGHETTSHLLTWTMLLLCVYPEWQEQLRREVLRECGGKENPTADMLNKLKEMTMVLLETLRLYCPVMHMLRRPISDIRLGSLSIPKGTTIAIPIPFLHRDKEVWGDNANEFDPSRFENGITNAAKSPQALLSFSIGPRSCKVPTKLVMAIYRSQYVHGDHGRASARTSRC